MISIIIPVYNVATYIEKCLVSVIEQTYVDYEVIIVDDCGDDSSIDIAKKVINEHNKQDIVTIIKHESNRGISAARNTGIKHANGDYILFIDSDDSLTIDCLEKLAYPLIQRQYDFIVGNYKLIYENKQYKKNKTSSTDLSKNHGETIGNQTILELFTHGSVYSMAWNKLINRHFLIENHLFFQEGLIHEDELWFFQVCCKANSCYFVDSNTYWYTIRSGSLQHDENIERHVKALFEVVRSMIIYSKVEHRFFDKVVFSYLIWYIKHCFEYMGSQSDDIAIHYYISIKKEIPKLLMNLLTHRCAWGQFKLLWHYKLTAKNGYRLYKKKYLQKS